MKKTLTTVFLALSVVCGTAFFSTSAQAVSLQDSFSNRLNQVAGSSGARLTGQNTDLRLAVAVIIRFLLGFIGIVFLVILVYAGFIWMTSGGNEVVNADAIRIIRNATVGLLIILISYALSTLIVTYLQRATTGTSGYGIDCTISGNQADPECTTRQY